MMMNFEDLTIFQLAEGAHGTAQEGLCAMEAVAWLEGEPHSDHPECVSPVLAAYTRRFNDRLGDADRQRLIPFLPKLVGTVAPELEQARAEYLAWQAVSVFTPRALDAGGFTEHATRLRNIPRYDWRAATRAADAAAEAAWAARAEAERAAGAARAAGRAADAAAEAARDAAWAEAERAAARAARAAEAAWAAGRAAARAADAARAVAWAADAAVAWAVAWAADAAGSADAGFDALDAAINLGPTSGFSSDIAPRVAAYREMAQSTL
jgi:hypothetical protein